MTAFNSFYQSKQWRRLAKAFMISKMYICERCGGVGEIAHHKQHISRRNIDNPDITLNPSNLECLCKDCHNTEHFAKGAAVLLGLEFDENGDIIPREGAAK